VTGLVTGALPGAGVVNGVVRGVETVGAAVDDSCAVELSEVEVADFSRLGCDSEPPPPPPQPVRIAAAAVTSACEKP
jgi:hypothetical protein